MSRSPRGRRPGAPDTREEILVAARTLFAEHGYAGTSLRAVAGSAGVDPALVHHYFAGKDDLFVASLRVGVDPRELIRAALPGDPERVGERLVRTLLGVWDDPAVQPALLGLARAVLEENGARLLRDGFLPVVLVPAGRALGIDRPERRMALVATQVLGLLLARYVLGIEPIASMPAEDLVGAVAPALQRYLTGPLDPPRSPP